MDPGSVMHNAQGYQGTRGSGGAQLQAEKDGPIHWGGVGFSGGRGVRVGTCRSSVIHQCQQDSCHAWEN